MGVDGFPVMGVEENLRPIVAHAKPKSLTNPSHWFRRSSPEGLQSELQFLPVLIVFQLLLNFGNLLLCSHFLDQCVLVPWAQESL